MLTFPLVLLLLAAALVCWPDVRVGCRLRLARHSGSRARLQRPQVSKESLARVAGVVWIPVLTVVATVVAGIGGLCSAIALAVLGTRYRRSRRVFRNGLARTTALAAGLRVLISELRAGAHPATAAEGAAADAPREVARVFRGMAATARLGGDATTVLCEQREQAHDLRGPVGRIVRAWTLAERHGVALAELLDSVRRDVEHRLAFVRDVEARMAGPRATAAVLACLPVLGLLLGEAVGSAPLGVLTGDLFGQILLVAGVGLLCGGMFWTARLTDAAVRP